MKHQTPDSMKFKKLQRLLGVSKATTVGTLELLWITTQKNAMRGDIGKFSNLEIAIECDWDGDPELLINSLIDSGWLDPCKEHRLVIHNWISHAPRYIHGVLSKKKLQFATTVGNCSVELQLIGDSSTVGNCSTLQPNLTQPNLTKPKKKKVFSYPQKFGQFWDVFPRGRKTGKLDALKAWKDAINTESPEAIIEAAKQYAGSPKGLSEYVLGPATWLRKGCWEDDRASWGLETIQKQRLASPEEVESRGYNFSTGELGEKK